MSYILDALRRSQAERDRGQVPGLNAQPAAVAAVPLRRGGPPWRWAVGALLAAAALAFSVHWLLRAVPAGRPDAPARTAADAADPALPTAAVPAAPPPPGGQRPALQAPPTLPVVVSVPPASVVPQATGAAVAIPPPSPSAGPAWPAVAPGAAQVTPPVASPAVAPARLPAAAVAVTPLAALTPEQRRELPPLVLGGSIWSDSAFSRFVIVNGQVVREGESAAPGVVIERIGPKAVLLRWRDLRLELPL